MRTSYDRHDFYGRPADVNLAAYHGQYDHLDDTDLDDEHVRRTQQHYVEHGGDRDSDLRRAVVNYLAAHDQLASRIFGPDLGVFADALIENDAALVALRAAANDGQ